MLRSPARLALAALLACLLAAAVPAAANAAAGTGTVTLGLGGKGQAAKALDAAGVKTSAIKPARKRRGARVVLPVRSVSVGSSATVALRGGIAFKAGRRALKLRSLSVTLSARRATVRARVGGARVPFFAAKLARGKAQLDRAATTATLSGTKLALTRKGAARLRAKLRVAGVFAGALGQVAVTAKPRTTTGNGGGGGGSAPGGGTTPGVPQSKPIKNEPPVAPRPAGAVDVTSASLTWRPRESWIQYINGGQGTSVFGGAVNGPAEVRPPSSASLVYSFLGFPFKSGWYEPATGKAAIYFQGGVGFRWSGHGINFSTANPEIEINGGASRAIFTLNGTENTVYDNQRGVLLDLHPSPIQTPASGTVTYTDVPATVPADAGSSVFAGFYAANEPFGSLTLSFTTP